MSADKPKKGSGMTPTAILESALYVSDLAAAETFYGDVLGLALIGKVEGRHVFFRCGAGVLLLFNADATQVPPAPDARLPVPPHGARGPGHLCFTASGEEIERWQRELSARGVMVEADFEWPNGGRSIYFRDPSGNSLEFAEPRIWGF
jgi:catechol 2,3-dioxygenase-like lactoylglutathione lyase family enzyme